MKEIITTNRRVTNPILSVIFGRTAFHNKTKGNAFLVLWDEKEAKRLQGELSMNGWNVRLETKDSFRAYSNIKSTQPDVVVIDSRDNEHSFNELAGALRSIKATRQMPIVAMNCSDEAKSHFADAHSTSEGILETISRFQRQNLNQ
ncbi:MAG TPA: hypothetical protein PL190_06020 [Caldisericia bacterium]|nr:MAG: hypothetical protein BWX90_01459 [bacterium ADurb.Bin132]HNW31469.1 hypothetical protein [Caldisericia bacterium]HNY61633.1 hypothetical protein [Caldisericia bacterium]HOC79484.1 hypothetical protein [Caldisericia bacterium]HOG70634.1 hypothetical protein [Caldisericia bacterium]